MMRGETRIHEELAEWISREKETLRGISRFIHENPELGYEEFQASRVIADYLEKSGFTVERGVGSLPTAVRAWFENEADEATPRVCIPLEYDALPGLGHGCGHNLIAVCSLAAAVAAAKYARHHHISFRICAMGTPAEEGKGGKIIMLREGAFSGMDLAVMAHPGARNSSCPGALGVARARVIFHGKASHAGANPQDGINALDAMMYFYMDMLRWKAALAPRERVHGIITKGGDAANIIPDLTEAFFYVRAPAPGDLLKLREKLEASARVGADKTGCVSEVKWVSAYKPILHNAPLNHRCDACWREAGEEVPLLHGTENCGSTDMGDVTWEMPGAHINFAISRGENCPGHSVAFREAAISEYAFESAMKCAGILARLVLEYSTDKIFKRAVDNDFKQGIHLS